MFSSLLTGAVAAAPASPLLGLAEAEGAGAAAGGGVSASGGSTSCYFVRIETKDKAGILDKTSQGKKIRRPPVSTYYYSTS